MEIATIRANVEEDMETTIDPQERKERVFREERKVKSKILRKRD